MALYEGKYKDGDPLSIGHPYVFQNDTEFIAGHFEMFFRNPHYFAHMNPDLYQGFALLFRQDPREAWEQDFPFYIQQNRGFLSEERQKAGFARPHHRIGIRSHRDATLPVPAPYPPKNVCTSR